MCPAFHLCVSDVRYLSNVLLVLDVWMHSVYCYAKSTNNRTERCDIPVMHPSRAIGIVWRDCHVMESLEDWVWGNSYTFLTVCKSVVVTRKTTKMRSNIGCSMLWSVMYRWVKGHENRKWLQLWIPTWNVANQVKKFTFRVRISGWLRKQILK
jgi:hypothetical protein